MPSVGFDHYAKSLATMQGIDVEPHPVDAMIARWDAELAGSVKEVSPVVLAMRMGIKSNRHEMVLLEEQVGLSAPVVTLNSRHGVIRDCGFGGADSRPRSARVRLRLSA